jgi:hypothetical protein
MNAQMQLMVKTSPGSSFTPMQAVQLQRKQNGEHEPDEDCPRCSKGLLNLRRSSANMTKPSSVPPIVHEILNSPGKPLDNETRVFMEPRFGHDFSKVKVHAAKPQMAVDNMVIGQPGDSFEQEADTMAQRAMSRSTLRADIRNDFSGVRIHADSKAAESANALNAVAYTVGSHIVFGAGRFEPGTFDGRRLLAHELTHVMQQSRDVHEKHVQRLVNPTRVTCSGYPRTYPIFRAIGTDDPVGELQAADSRATEVLSSTIDELTSARARIQAGEPAAWPVINDCMAQSMRIRLLIDPDNPASWTRSGPNTVERIIRMLTNLRGVFQGGYIRYSCLDGGCNANDDAFILDGERYLIRLCRGFWGMDTDYRAIVLIHELAHIYYNTEDRGFLGLGSSYCIEGFLNNVNGINVPAIYRSDCRGNQVDAC